MHEGIRWWPSEFVRQINNATARVVSKKSPISAAGDDDDDDDGGDGDDDDGGDYDDDDVVCLLNAWCLSWSCYESLLKKIRGQPAEILTH